MNKYNILREIVERYEYDRLDLLQEELAELIQAISKYKRYGELDNIIEEIADVEIMISQIKILLSINEHSINEVKKEKFQRIKNIMGGIINE